MGQRLRKRGVARSRAKWASARACWLDGHLMRAGLTIGESLTSQQGRVDFTDLDRSRNLHPLPSPPG